MNTYINRLFRAIALLPCLFLAVVACDTEYEDAPYPFKDITTFSVVAEDTHLSAAVAGNQIVLYWPHTLAQPATISPQITVSENAAITPASGTAVPFQDGLTYTVTAQDGTTAVYTLKLIMNQPEITLSEEEDYRIAFGGLLDIRGANFLLDSIQNEVYLIAQNGTETQVPVYALADASGSGFASNIQVSIPAENATAIDTGWYKIKIRSGARSKTSSRALVYVRYPYPDFDNVTTSISVKRGETITLTGQSFRQLGDARIWVQDGSENFYDIGLISHTLTTVTYRIPDTVPAGEYFTILPGITDIVSGEFSYSYELYSFPNIHPLLIVTD